MAINIEQAIKWMYGKKGKVTYSMTYRNGPNSYDCSSAVYYALRSGGATNNGWPINTESAHKWLVKNGFKLVSENRPFSAQRGDVFIWGKRGYSLGSGGHTGIFVDGDNIIHCTSAVNGITVNDHDQVWARSGKMYYYCYRYMGPSIIEGKSIEKLAKEVIDGKHGTGEERKRILGSKYSAVQKKVNEILNIGKDNSKVALFFGSSSITENILNSIIKTAKEYDILPSYALTVLHYESLWGSSNVAKVDNNWAGITWSGHYVRPSGVRVTRGTARPRHEGGYYIHYNTLEDFFKDWFHLLRPGGIYKVAGKKSFDEAVKGMFKVGGAKYDYAQSGYGSYSRGMKARLKAIEKVNGPLSRFDKIVSLSSNKNKRIAIVYVNDGDLANAQVLLNSLPNGVLIKSDDVTDLKESFEEIIQVGGYEIKGATMKLKGNDRRITLNEVSKYLQGKWAEEKG